MSLAQWSRPQSASDRAGILRLIKWEKSLGKGATPESGLSPSPADPGPVSAYHHGAGVRLSAVQSQLLDPGPESDMAEGEEVCPPLVVLGHRLGRLLPLYQAVHTGHFVKLHDAVRLRLHGHV